ncbi:MAG: HIT family protein [Sphingomonadaceae bacterium]
MNETIKRFGYPETLVAEYPHWVVLVRPEQPTLGSLILAAKSEATAFSDLPTAAFAELALVTGELEHALKRFVNYEKINYLMLMMVDRHVHFHVLPRYEGTRSVADIAVADQGWPKAPSLGAAVALEADGIAALVSALRREWGA